MKRISPMKQAKKPTAMESYAKKRNADMSKMPSVSVMEFHDPDHDLHTLTKAEEIKKDKKRHSGAMGAAKKKQATLKTVMGKA